MTGRQRLARMCGGLRPDRRPFVPSVYEHGAALIGRGCVPYDTPPEHVLRFKQLCLAAK